MAYLQLINRIGNLMCNVNFIFFVKAIFLNIAIWIATMEQAEIPQITQPSLCDNRKGEGVVQFWSE